MLHLAQVKQNASEGKVLIQLLAQQKAEYAWAVLDEDEPPVCLDPDQFDSDRYREGILVLVELSPTRQVQEIYDATQWVLEVVNQFLAFGITPAMLQEEVQRAEQWRQSLTLQSQELGRRALEVEARRDQMQELEESLKQEKQAIDTITAQLKASAQAKSSPSTSDSNGAIESAVPESAAPESAAPENAAPENAASEKQPEDQIP